jgi:Ketopantoate reductase PanE/ApbA C terminal
MAEACAVAKASGAEVDAAQIQAIYDGLPSGMRSSMQKDLASMRQLELDAIGGPIVRGGERSSPRFTGRAACKRQLWSGSSGSTRDSASPSNNKRGCGCAR